MFVGGDGVHPDPLQVPDGGSEPCCLGDRRGAGFKPVGRVRVGGVSHLNHLDHLPPSEEGRQRLQELSPAPQHTDAGRTAHLVSGEGHQVSSELSDINALVRCRLGRVDHHHRPDRMSLGGDIVHWVAGTQHIAHVGDGDHLGTFVDQSVAFGGLEIEPALVGDVEPAEHRPGPFTHQLPGNNVRVMFHDGDHHFVAGDQSSGHGVGH